MATGELIGFGFLVLLVIVIALIGRRMQTVHPAPGVGGAEGHNVGVLKGTSRQPPISGTTTDTRDSSSTRVRQPGN